MIHPAMDSNPNFHNREFDELPEESLQNAILATPFDGISDALNLFHAFDQKLNTKMTLGSEKGDIINKLLQSVMETFSNEPINILEMGSHLGDGSLHILHSIKGKAPQGSKLFSLDDPHIHSIGAGIVKSALSKEKSGNHAEYVPLMNMPLNMPDILDSLMNGHHKIKKIHFVFMDHGDHTTFGDDIKHLMKSGILAKGAKIVADNGDTKKQEKSSFFDFIDQNQNKFTKETKIPVNNPTKDSIVHTEYIDDDSHKDDL
jgi:predicted O-methyltransferase YrrM